MLATYTFNSHYNPVNTLGNQLPSLRLLEGGKFNPAQYSPILVHEYGQIRLKFFRWGMVPGWSKDDGKQNQRLFAAAEHLFDHVAYRVPVRRKRCLIPADGFYVESGNVINKQTYKLSQPDNTTFCFAGIYDTWKKRDGSILHSFAMVTTPANESLNRFGLQMPFILPKNLENAWLNDHTSLRTNTKILSQSLNPNLKMSQVQELKGTQEFNGLEQVAA